MGSCFNIENSAEHLWEKIHLVHLVRPAWYRVLLLKEKRAHYHSKSYKFIVLYENGRSLVTVNGTWSV